MRATTGGYLSRLNHPRSGQDEMAMKRRIEHQFGIRLRGYVSSCTEAPCIRRRNALDGYGNRA